MVTGNKNKLAEAKAILHDFNLVNVAIDLPELQGTPEEIVLEKAKLAYKRLKKPCFVEDVAFGFKTWNWLPGPYIKDFLKHVGVENIPRLLRWKRKNAKAVCTIGYATKNGVKIFSGQVHGRITSHGGREGFGFDRIFIPKGKFKRWSEIPKEEKNKESHRALALKKLRAYLEKE